MSFRTFLEGRPVRRELLETFLAANQEWTRVEFKEANQLPEFGLKKAVCAQANTEGGGVFLGVTDEGRLDTGTSIGQDAISAVLSADREGGDQLFATDLSAYVPSPVVPVELGNGSRVYVLEVIPNGIPCLVLDRESGYQMFERRLRASVPMDARRILERASEMGRTKMLREIYTEMDHVSREIGHIHESREPPDPMLPRFERLYVEGVWTKYASKGDWGLLNDGYIGALRSYPRAWAQTQRAYMPHDRINGWNTLHQYQEEIRNAVVRFAEYLRTEKIALPT